MKINTAIDPLPCRLQCCHNYYRCHILYTEFPFKVSCGVDVVKETDLPGKLPFRPTHGKWQLK